MRLEITRRAELAVRAVATLGRAEGRLKSGDLAGALGTTTGFVPQVVGPLVKAGWVRSEPGPTGGYSLTRPLGSLNVLDVIEALDGATDDGRCVVADRPCGDQGATCALHDAWRLARERLTDSLRQTSLVDVRADLLTTPSSASRTR